MNTIDLIACLAVLVAIWDGWRKGFVVQVCSLAGLVAAIWLASRYGTLAGEWLRIDAQYAEIGGFIAVLVVVVIAVAIAARLLRKLFHFAGFGIPDHLLGVAVSVLKCLLLLSILLRIFDKFNGDYALVDATTIEQSKTYRPVRQLSEQVLPFLDWVGERLPAEETPTEEKTPEEVQNR